MTDEFGSNDIIMIQTLLYVLDAARESLVMAKKTATR